MDRFLDFFEETYNVHVLTVSSQRVRPGAILDTTWVRRKSWPIRSRVPEFGGVRGYAWDLLDEDEDAFPTDTYDGQILVGSLTDRIDLTAGLSIPFLGLEIGSGFEGAVSARLQVDEVRKTTFVDGFAGDRLRNALRRRKEEDADAPISVDRDHLVTSTYHFENLKWVFEEDGGAEIQAAIERGLIEVDPQFEATWKDKKHELEFTGSCGCPVAFDGLKI